MEVNHAILKRWRDQPDMDVEGFWARAAQLPWFRRWDPDISTIEKARRTLVHIREEAGAPPRPEHA
jgi:hypothetical protein